MFPVFFSVSTVSCLIHKTIFFLSRKSLQLILNPFCHLCLFDMMSFEIRQVFLSIHNGCYSWQEIFAKWDFLGRVISLIGVHVNQPRIELLCRRGKSRVLQLEVELIPSWQWSLLVGAHWIREKLHGFVFKTVNPFLLFAWQTNVWFRRRQVYISKINEMMF